MGNLVILWSHLINLFYYIRYYTRNIHTSKHTRCSQRQISMVLQVLDIFDIWICHIVELFWLPKVTRTPRKQPTEHDGDGNKNKVYPNTTDYLYPLAHVIIRLDEP